MLKFKWKYQSVVQSVSKDSLTKHDVQKIGVHYFLYVRHLTRRFGIVNVTEQPLEMRCTIFSSPQ